MSGRNNGRTAGDSGVLLRLILVLTSDRAFTGTAKPRASVQRESEGETGQSVVSEVLGSSGVKTMGPKV
jgi:hypothetical protein